MIPILSVLNLASALIALGSAIAIYQSYKRGQSEALKHFLFFYSFFSLFWLSWSFPGIFTNNLAIISTTNTLGYGFQYLSIIALYQIPFLFVESKWAKIGGSILLALAGILFVAMRSFQFSLPHVEVIGLYIYWKPLMPYWLRIMTGIAGAFVSITFIIMLFVFGLKNSSNRAIYQKSLYLSSGALSMLFGALSAFVVSPGAGFGGNMIGSIFVIIGLLVMLRGILYE